LRNRRRGGKTLIVHLLREGERPILIVWREDFSTGIAEVDHRHKALIWLVNGLSEAFRTSKDPETLGTILSILADYASFHFTRGQRLMRTARYPVRDEYAALHEELMKRLDTLVYRFETGSGGAETLPFLKDWLLRLIDQDRAFGRALAAEP